MGGRKGRTMRLGFLWGILSGGVMVAALGWLVVASTEPPEPRHSAVVQQPGGNVIPAVEPQGPAKQPDGSTTPAATPGNGVGEARGSSGERSGSANTVDEDRTTAPVEAAAEPEADPAESADDAVSGATPEDAATASEEASAGVAPGWADGQSPGTEGSGPLAAVAPTEPVDARPTAQAPEREGPETAPAQPDDALAPRFDVVRVDATGQTVIAGHAQPGQEVEVLLDGEVVQKVRADAAGNFVAVVTAELGDRSRQLQLRVTVPEAGATGTPPAEGELDAGPAQPGIAVGEARRAAEPAAAAEGSAATEPAPSAAAQPGELAASAPSSGAPVPGPAPDALPRPEATAARPGRGQMADAAPSVEGLRVPEDAAPSALVTSQGDGAGASGPGPGAGAVGSQFAAAATEGLPTSPASGAAGSDKRPGDDTADATPPAGSAAKTAPGEVAVAVATPEDQPNGPTGAEAGAPRAGAADGAPDSDTNTTAATGGPSTAGDPPTAGAGTEPASGSPASDADTPEPGLRYVLSAPVLILPSQEGDGAPALVRPGEEELALLQPGGESSGRPAGGVVLDQITYDPDGDLLVRGRAADRHAVRIYGNGRLLDTVPVRKGTWRVSLARDRVADLSLFRFDEVGAAGQVTSRIEAPFRYTGERPQVLRDREIVIQRGDNLWRIAEQVYGEGLRYSVIYGANSELIRDPDLIYPDQVFTIPELVEAE